MPRLIREKVASMNGKQKHYSGSASVCHITTPKSLIGGGVGGLKHLDVIIMA